jgi:hypothetical protein
VQQLIAGRALAMKAFRPCTGRWSSQRDDPT